MCDFFQVNSLDPERLKAESVDEAIQEYLDSFDYESAKRNDSAPEIVCVQGYKKMVLSVDDSSFSLVLDDLMENVDETFNPQGEIDQSPEITIAYKAFVKAFVEKYQVWSCEAHGEEISVSLKEFFEKESEG